MFQWRKLGGDYGRLREERRVQMMVTRVADAMVFVWYTRTHFCFDQKTKSTQTSSKATQDTGVQVERQQRSAGIEAWTQTGRCKQKDAETQVGVRTKIGVDNKGTQVQVRNKEQGCQVTPVCSDKITQAGHKVTEEISIQTDRQRRKDTGTQVNGREKNPGGVAHEEKEQQGVHVHIASETARGSQVQIKLVEAMRMHKPKAKITASRVMQMCQIFQLSGY